MDLLRGCGDLGIVRDDEYRALLRPVQVAKQRADRPGRLRVEIASRLVRQNDVWLREERARDRDPLLLAAGELLGFLFEDAVDAKRRDERRKPLFVDLRAVEAKRQDDVVAHRPLVEEVERLEDDSYVAAAELGGLGVSHLRYIIAADENLARVRGKKPGGEMEKRRFAAPARAHQRLEAARRHLQGKVLEDFLLAVSAAHAACVKGFHHSSIESILSLAV